MQPNYASTTTSYGLYLYYSSRSFRLAAKCLSSSFMVKRSHVTIWKWIQRYAFLATIRFTIDKHKIRQILIVDETLVKIDGLEHWLWIAYEPNMNVCLMMHLSRVRIIFVCYQFFKQLRHSHGKKLISTDGARWYNIAWRWLELPHQIYGTELKNIIVRFIQHIKDTTEYIYRIFILIWIE
ncbi:MAG TPA: DDE-type integrase/transposase/recombinase [Nitrososphaeraceae archaeon]|jgi:transposase-like protein